MPRPKSVPPHDIHLDLKNYRLSPEPASAAQALHAVAELQGHKLVALAEDIVKFGLDPSAPILVMSAGKGAQGFVVREGNRRITALKALENPALVGSALSTGDRKALATLSEEYLKAPIQLVPCIEFDDDEEDQLEHWIEIRHSGEMDGRGTLSWDALAKAKFRASRGDDRPALALLRYLEQRKLIDTSNHSRKEGILTNLERLINTPEMRQALGIELHGGKVSLTHNPAEVEPRLVRLVDDLKSKRIRVADIYEKKDRRKVARDFSRELPLPEGSRLSAPRGLDDPGPVNFQAPVGGAAPPQTRRRPDRDRETLIPRASRLRSGVKRIDEIIKELRDLTVGEKHNACAVLLRVLVEMSVNHYLTRRQLAPSKEQKLAKRLVAAADDLRQSGKIDAALHRLASTAGSRQTGVLAASTVTFNQYVHNKYVLPPAAELLRAWDELEPFMAALLD